MSLVIFSAKIGIEIPIQCEGILTIFYVGKNVLLGIRNYNQFCKSDIEGWSLSNFLIKWLYAADVPRVCGGERRFGFSSSFRFPHAVRTPAYMFLCFRFYSRAFAACTSQPTPNAIIKFTYTPTSYIDAYACVILT